MGRYRLGLVPKGNHVLDGVQIPQYPTVKNGVVCLLNYRLAVVTLYSPHEKSTLQRSSLFPNYFG